MITMTRTALVRQSKRSVHLLALLLLGLLGLVCPLQPLTPMTRPMTALMAAGGTAAPPMEAEEVGARYKRIVYGQGPGAKASIEVIDRLYRSCTETLLVDRRQGGSLGLELFEAPSGIVFVGAVREGSVTAGLLLPGDSLIMAEGLDSPASEPRYRVAMEGAGFDDTIDALGALAGSTYARLTVKRLARRGEITVRVFGPSDEFVTNFTVLSGYGANLRTALNSNNLRLYDDSTARFDSPFQTGNCGGEGTCGTCVVAVVQGRESLNDRVRVEDQALKKQGAPPTWR